MERRCRNCDFGCVRSSASGILKLGCTRSPTYTLKTRKIRIEWNGMEWNGNKRVDSIFRCFLPIVPRSIVKLSPTGGKVPQPLRGCSLPCPLPPPPCPWHHPYRGHVLCSSRALSIQHTKPRHKHPKLKINFRIFFP